MVAVLALWNADISLDACAWSRAPGSGSMDDIEFRVCFLLPLPLVLSHF